MPIETKKALIVVRTYPTPAKKGVESSCTAAITDTGEWLRLFPVPYRFLSFDQRFVKYQWIEARVRKASDARPESYKLEPNGITIVSPVLPTAAGWKQRKEFILPLKAQSLCSLSAERDKAGSPTLGIFKPERIVRLIIEDDDPEWTEAQLDILRQQNLFGQGPKEELEKVPFKFKYEFYCDHDGCKGHKISCTDWEMGESWRKYRDKYGEEGWKAKFRQRYETEMIEKYDTHFYVGTVHTHPHIWIIVGLFYPPKSQLAGGFFDDEK